MDKKIKLRDYIYFDNELVSSILAQLMGGLPTIISEMNGKSETEDSTNKTSADGHISGNKMLLRFLGFNFSGGVSKEFANSNSSESTYNKKTDFMYKDYAFNIIKDKLSKNNNVIDISKAQEGDFVDLTSDFNLVDLSIVNSLNETKNKVHRQVVNETNDGNFDKFKNNISFLNIMFKDAVLIKAENNTLTLAKSKNMRLDKTQSEIINMTERKLNIFGILSSASEENLFKNNAKDSVGALMSYEYIKGIKTALNIDNKITNIKVINPIAMYFE